MSRYVLTGAAGFIGSKVAELLLTQGHSVIGIDDLNPAYDVRIKHYRLARLQEMAGFTFHKMDIADRAGVFALEQEASQSAAVINLAARAGVRASVEDPWVYVDTNVTCGTARRWNMWSA